MDKNVKPDNRRIEDKLAEYTDQIMLGPWQEGMVFSDQDQELQKLQNTVRRVKNAMERERPDEEMATRIYNRAVVAWRTTELRIKKWQRQKAEKKRRMPAWMRQLFSQPIKLAVAVAAFLFIIFISFPQVSSSLPATTLTARPAIYIFLIILIVISVIFLWKKND